MSIILAFDLETVPDTVAGRRLHGLEGTPDEVAAAMLELRRKETDGRTDFLKPAFHRIVAIGAAAVALRNDSERGRAQADPVGPAIDVNLKAWSGAGEAALLSLFFAWLKKRPQLVSWNGSGFDLPVIRYRALLHGMDAATLYGPPEQKQWDSYGYRYGNAHVDLMDVLAGHGASTSHGLDELARLAGLPGKTVATGDQVSALAHAGEWDRIKAYVGSDAIQTLLLFLRWEVGRGRLPRGTYVDVLRAIAEKVSDAALAGAIGSWVQEAVEEPAGAA